MTEGVLCSDSLLGVVCEHLLEQVQAVFADVWEEQPRRGWGAGHKLDVVGE